MEKIIALVLFAMVVGAIASRNVRSPGGSGWQGGNNFGRGSSGLSRSSVSSWSNYGGGRSAGDGARGAWGRSTSGFGSDGDSWGKSWQDSSSGRAYGGYESSNHGGLGRSSGFDQSFGKDYSSGWDNSGSAYSDNSGWQTSSW